MRFNPKGVYFWGAGFACAACVTFGLSNGAIAFGILMVAIAVLG